MTSARTCFLILIVAMAGLTLASPLLAVDQTTTGTASAMAPSSTWLAFEVPFTGDADRDGWTVVELGLAPGGPFDVAETWKIPGPAEWRAETFRGLTPDTDYYVRVTFVDPDGVSGTNPQVVGPVHTLASAANAVTLGTATAVVGDAEILLSQPISGDANGNSLGIVELATDPGGPWTEKCGSPSENRLPYHPRRCRLRSLVPGTDYWVRIDNSDPDGVSGTDPQVLGPITYTGPANLAAGRPITADPGWGCCPNPAQLVDGRIQYRFWPYGFAWTGGTTGYGGGPPGWKQATVDLGPGSTFDRVEVWLHGSNSPPTDWRLETSDDGASWNEIWATTDPQCRGATEQLSGPSWQHPNCSQGAAFAPVTARYLRYWFDDTTLFGGLHGWAVELEVFASATACSDNDGDGYGFPGDASCPNGTAEDCDDADSDVYPGNSETTCDTKDNDCSAATLDDPNADGDPVSLCSGDCDDGDVNTYPGAAPNDSASACMKDGDADDFGDDSPPAGVTAGTDCDDTNVGINPAQVETYCDSIDQDCDGADDVNADGDPVSLCSGDCDDGDSDVYPGNTETTCDTKDNDCSASTLDDPNADGDPVSLCSGDCDDGDADVFPGNSETTCDTKDNDCSAATLDDPNADGDPVSLCSGDCDDGDVNTYPGAAPNDSASACMKDGDADDFGDDSPPAGVTAGTDCDDTNVGINPAQVETYCDSIDQDCDGADDVNADGDPVSLCSGDCDDGDSDVYPGNTETTCDTKDNDCSASTLDDPNADGDPVSLCSGDCDDGDADVYPGNSETTCDLKDNDCSAATLDDPNGDGDPVSLCSGDCDDGDADVFPGNSETTCDTKDNDCSASTLDDPNADGDPVSLCSGDCDDGDSDVYPGNTETTCDTKDNDCSASTLDDPNGDGDPVSLCSGDCDDGDSDVYPGNSETICDTKDNDCSAATPDVVPPGFAKSFVPDTILGIGQSTLSFTIDNGTCGLPAADLAFSNLLPYDLLVADTPAVVNTCGGTVTAPGGSAGIDIFGGTVAGGESCGLSVAIAAPSIGSFVNTTGDLTSSTGNSGTASATLTVLDCPAANGSHMTLPSGVVLMRESYEVCNTIEVPEHFLVLGPSGVLALHAGVAVIFNNGVEIGSDGVLEVTIDPSLFVP